MRILVAALLLAAGTANAAPLAAVAAESEIGFVVTQMGVPVSGRFTRFDARADLEAARAEVTVDIASLATGDDDADTTARDAPWLDAAHFPKATFTSAAVRRVAPGRYEARGLITLRGKPREITVPIATTAAGTRTVATGSFTLRRSDFGIGGGEWNEDDVVADPVQVRFRLTLAPVPAR